ncbi:hypothetical protein ACOSQ3_032594 [Xanthoceras sorbifolium]
MSSYGTVYENGGSRFDILEDDVRDVVEGIINHSDNNQKATLADITYLKAKDKVGHVTKKKEKGIGEGSQSHYKKGLDLPKKAVNGSSSSRGDTIIQKGRNKDKKKLDMSRNVTDDSVREEVGVLQQIHMDIMSAQPLFMDTSQHPMEDSTESSAVVDI